MGKVGIKLNLSNGGLTQVSDWEFNSFAQVYETVYGAKQDSLCKLCGETDNGTAIDAVVITPNADFTVETNKRVRKLYYSGTGTDLELVQETAGTVYAQTFETETYVTRKTLKGNRNCAGLNWQFTVRNKNGAAFCIDTLAVLFNPLTRSRGTR